VGTYTEAMVAGPVFENAQIPLVNIWDSAPEIEALGNYVFGIGVWTPSSSEVSAKYARENIKAKTAVTICNNGEWSLEVAKAFRENFEKDGGKVLDHFEINPGESDFRTILLKVKSLNPDVIYAPVTDNISAFWLQLGRSGYTKTVITSDILNQEILNQVGSSAEGVYQTQAADPSSPATIEMLDAYKAKHGKDCTQVFFTSLGYDSVMFLAKAMQTKGLKRNLIKDGLYEIANYPGASGVATMTPEGSVKRIVSVFQVKDSKLVPVS
ncbi:MAG: ABC transporter substrate-binding protein, partial [Deltaproteobacteria bacterium]|nr:ABC transporter substrate-binding protein [Deltaproteobacteria bacterium]